jgi:hypothetical protein
MACTVRRCYYNTCIFLLKACMFNTYSLGSIRILVNMFPCDAYIYIDPRSLPSLNFGAASVVGLVACDANSERYLGNGNFLRVSYDHTASACTCFRSACVAVRIKHRFAVLIANCNVRLSVDWIGRRPIHEHALYG